MATKDRARHPFPRILARRAGSPKDVRAESRQCFPWPRQREVLHPPQQLHPRCRSETPSIPEPVRKIASKSPAAMEHAVGLHGSPENRHDCFGCRRPRLLPFVSSREL